MDLRSGRLDSAIIRDGAGTGPRSRDSKGYPLFSFDKFSLDPGRRELRCVGELCSVEPQVFDLLEFLIRNRDRIVSRDDLLAAVWNGRIVSEATLTSRINAARTAIGDNGKDQRLIRTILRKGVRFVGAVREHEKPPIAVIPDVGVDPVRPALVLPYKPSIAVLPFTNLSSDPEQQYFADGVVEEIITALSRFSGLFVIARNSSFTYKGRPVDIKQVGSELGVRYVLEGSVRQGGNRVRITGQLIDAATGAHLWADRFDGDPNDIFDLQDQVTRSVVGAIAPKLEQAEIEHAKRKPTESLGAYDYYLRGIESFHQQTQASVSEALRLFARAMELDPHFAVAFGMSASCYVRRQASNWMIDRALEVSETARLAREAVRVSKDDADVLARAGHALAYVVHEFDAGEMFIDRALAMNPNLANAWLSSVCLRVWIGEPDKAIRHFAEFERLNPRDPRIPTALSVNAFAHFFAGRYDEASAQAERVLQESPNFHLGLRVAIASSALAGRIERAKNALSRLRQIDPALRVANLGDLTPLRRQQDRARYAEGMRKAGLPD